MFTKNREDAIHNVSCKIRTVKYLAENGEIGKNNWSLACGELNSAMVELSEAWEKDSKSAKVVMDHRAKRIAEGHEPPPIQPFKSEDDIMREMLAIQEEAAIYLDLCGGN